MKLLSLAGAASFLLTLAPVAAAPSPFGIWQYMGAQVPTQDAPYARGKLIRASWDDLQPAPDRWTWDEQPKGIASSGEETSTVGFESQLRAAAAAHLRIMVVVFVGARTPEWVYAEGVRRVRVDGTHGAQGDHYPDYFSETYNREMHRFVVALRDHLLQEPPEIRDQVFALQFGLSSTGDYYAYHGTLRDPRDEISDDRWLHYFEATAQFCADTFRPTPFRLLFNPSNSAETSGVLIPFLRKISPGLLIKVGNTGHMYQLNNEREQIAALRRAFFSPLNGDYLHARSEFGEDWKTGEWVEAPAWNMFTLLEAGLYTGLDVECLERGATILGNPQLYPAFAFFDRYAGQKDPATAPGAWCGLRDGLDASDETRFPPAQFGAAEQDNVDRYVKIAAAFARRGARQEDAAGGIRNGIASRRLKGLNDVAWDSYTGDYDYFLSLEDPAGSSVGYWRVGPKDQPYGRYARGFDAASGRNTLRFRFDPRFAASAGSGELRIVYFDRGSNRWSVQAGDRTLASVEQHHTQRWQEAVLPMAAATGFSIRNDGGGEGIFALVEFRRSGKDSAAATAAAIHP